MKNIKHQCLIVLLIILICIPQYSFSKYEIMHEFVAFNLTRKDEGEIKYYERYSYFIESYYNIFFTIYGVNTQIVKKIKLEVYPEGRIDLKRTYNVPVNSNSDCMPYFHDFEYIDHGNYYLRILMYDINNTQLVSDDVVVNVDPDF